MAIKHIYPVFKTTLRLFGSLVSITKDLAKLHIFFYKVK